MALLCTRCKTRPAVVFVQRLDGSQNTKNEGYCIKCAKDLGIKPVTDMLKGMGIDDEQLEMMSDEMEALMSGGMDGMGFEMNEDDEADDDSDGDETESRAPSVNLGSIFGNLSSFRKNDEGEETMSADKGKKKKADKHRKNLEAFCMNLTEKARNGNVDRVSVKRR